MENENYEEIRAKKMRFGAVGDFVKGTLTGVSKTTSPDAYGKLSHIYTVRVQEGSFLGNTKNEKTGKFKDDAAPTIMKAKDDYTFFVSNDKGLVLANLKDVKIGQKFMIKFTELKPSTKGQDAHILKVFAGKDAQGLPLMDQEYIDSLKSDAEKAKGEYDAM
jgi:hypothetical protein